MLKTQDFVKDGRVNIGFVSDFEIHKHKYIKDSILNTMSVLAGKKGIMSFLICFD